MPVGILSAPQHHERTPRIHTDAHGHPLSGASAEAAALYDKALRQFQCYTVDPVAILQQAVADSPRFVMGHAMLAWLMLSASVAGPADLAAASLRTAEGLPATPREQAHLRAAATWAGGRWRAAARALEDLSVAHPRDALALQMGHLLDFFTGNARMLRDRISRALPAWSADLPGFHAILGMHAFGLEECGQYPLAESTGRRAVELDRRDGWAWHAVAHVMEMQGRVDEGIRWLGADSASWSKDNFFAVHNWWRLALYHLERDQIPEVLALFDGPIFGHGPGTAGMPSTTCTRPWPSSSPAAATCCPRFARHSAAPARRPATMRCSRPKSAHRCSSPWWRWPKATTARPHAACAGCGRWRIASVAATPSAT